MVAPTFFQETPLFVEYESVFVNAPPRTPKSKKSPKSQPYDDYKHDLSPDEEVFFQKYGIEVDVDFKNLKKTYRNLQTRLHPDRGGDSEEFKKLQKLYDKRYNQHKENVLPSNSKKSPKSEKSPKSKSKKNETDIEQFIMKRQAREDARKERIKKRQELL
jgi:hypothetical protein